MVSVKSFTTSANHDQPCVTLEVVMITVKRF